MKISIIIAVWSSSSSLALPTIMLKSTASNSAQNHQPQSGIDALALSSAYLADTEITDREL